MASSNSSIKVHPKTIPLNPNAPVFEPLSSDSFYRYTFKRMPFYYFFPQRWTFATSAFPQYQYQQPSFLSQYYWPYRLQGHQYQGHHRINESGKLTLLSHVVNTDFGVESTATVMSKEQQQPLVSNEKYGFYWGRKRVTSPRLMKKPNGSIISDSSSSINRNERLSFCGKRWIPKHRCDQKGNADPENNINEAVLPIEVTSVECNDVCGPEVDILHCGKTTVMIRNVPNQFGRQHLLKILDEYCRKENMKVESSSRNDLCWSEYDFVYLPIDYGRRLNKGYAFVNFTTDTAAVRFWQAFHQLKWEYYQFDENSRFRSRKICQICWAKCQGKHALKDNFRNRAFPEDEYRPVSMEPSSDGSPKTTSLGFLIGNRRNKRV